MLFQVHENLAMFYYKILWAYRNFRKKFSDTTVWAGVLGDAKFV